MVTSAPPRMQCKRRSRPPRWSGRRRACPRTRSRGSSTSPLESSGAGFVMPPEEERAASLGAVLHVLYLVFNEGYAASSGEVFQRVDLSNEAIRLARAVHELLPESGEVGGLLALMLLTDARR